MPFSADSGNFKYSNVTRVKQEATLEVKMEVVDEDEAYDDYDEDGGDYYPTTPLLRYKGLKGQVIEDPDFDVKKTLASQQWPATTTAKPNAQKKRTATTTKTKK